MKNKKQTAVEWLVSQQQPYKFFTKIIIEQAKEMEKQQIQDLKTKIEDLTAENEQYERELNELTIKNK